MGEYLSDIQHYVDKSAHSNDAKIKQYIIEKSALYNILFEIKG